MDSLLEGEGVKGFRRVRGLGLQQSGKFFEFIVGRVPSRGVFQFLQTIGGEGDVPKGKSCLSDKQVG